MFCLTYIFFIATSEGELSIKLNMAAKFKLIDDGIQDNKIKTLSLLKNCLK